MVILLVGAMPFGASSARAGGSCRGGPFEDRATTEIKTTRDCFLPTVARVEVGDTVSFFNGEEVLHTVGGVAGSFGNMHTELGPGEKLSFTFDREGVYPYVCLLHPGMAGAIVVGDGKGKTTSGGVTQVGTPVSDAGGPPEDAPAGTPAADSTPAGSWLVISALAAAIALLGWFVIRGRRRETGPAPSPGL